MFAGRFRLDWAREVCGFGPLVGGQVADLLDALVVKSLVAAERLPPAPSTGCCSPFAITPRTVSPSGARARRPSAAAPPSWSATSRRATPSSDSPPRPRLPRRGGGAADEVRASLSWCLAQGDGDQACALIAAVYRWWNVTGRIEELCPLAGRAVAVPSGPSLNRVITYYALMLGLEAADAEQQAHARARADEMLAEAMVFGDDNGLALALGTARWIFLGRRETTRRPPRCSARR